MGIVSLAATISRLKSSDVEPAEEAFAGQECALQMAGLSAAQAAHAYANIEIES